MIDGVIKTLLVFACVFYTYMLYRQGGSYYGNDHDEVWSAAQERYNSRNKIIFYYILILLFADIAALGGMIFEDASILDGTFLISFINIDTIFSIGMVPVAWFASAKAIARWRREFGVGYQPEPDLPFELPPLPEPTPSSETPPCADDSGLAEPDAPAGHFRFRCAPIWDSPLFGQFLSDQTQRALLRSEWATSLSLPSDGLPEVFLCEAFGGANGGELAALFAAIIAGGQRVILVWTDDWPFPVQASADLLVFDIAAPAPRGCTYTWQAQYYGPGKIAGWKPFTDRPILASFIGSRKTHACREIVFDAAVTGRPDMVIEDVDWWSSMGAEGGDEFRAARAARFDDVLANSKFAFCPRGNGPSSMRRWEAAYAGAIPLLIDDATQPFGLVMPLIDFRPDGAGSVHDNAMALLARLVQAFPGGGQLQDDLRTCLLPRFDAPLVSASHTSVRLIVDVANRTWIHGKGFARDVH